MSPKNSILFLLAVLLVLSPIAVSADMDSENYHMGSTAFSGGGNPTGSSNYTMEGTIGQPSPLMDPIDPPMSVSYDLWPGFWYAALAEGSTCPGDSEPDGDVDGTDLYEHLLDAGGVSLSDFAAVFGRDDCF
jgi:hypothetical protein